MRLAFLFLAAALVIGLACNNLTGGNTCKAVAADVSIDARDQGGFSPTPVTVSSVDRVCWQNLGTITHTVTTVVPATDTIDEALPPDAVFDHVFSTRGSDIHYYCKYHPAETGLIQVR